MTVPGTVRRVHTVMDSPVDKLTLVATGGTLSGLYMEQQRHRPPEDVFGEPNPEPFTDVVAQLDEYFASAGPNSTCQSR